MGRRARQIIASLEGCRGNTIGTIIVIDLQVSDNPGTNQALAHHLDIHALRQGLIYELKLRIDYIEAKDRARKRSVWPLDVQDYGPNGAIFAWCEKRENFRNLRFDRITELAIIHERFETPGSVMMVFTKLFRTTNLQSDNRLDRTL